MWPRGAKFQQVLGSIVTSSTLNGDDLHVHVILYVATENAINYLQTYGEKVFSPISFKVIAIHTLPDSISFDEESEKEILELIKQYGADNLKDEHFSQGKTDKLYLGFNEGGLPLIIHHNTPNNSLPILWRNDNKSDFKGLFPRFSRHQ